LVASIQMRRRLSCTFFSTTPFSQPEATLQKSGVEQVVRAHHREALVDDAALALLDLVDRGLHVVVDAAARHAAQRREERVCASNSIS
jgi:hypothetical protein